MLAWRRTSAAWIFAAIALAIALPLLVYIGRAGVLDLSFMRRTGVNLQATRGHEPPTVWLVAHLDSKWQPVSMIARVAGVIVTAVALVSALVSSLGPIDVPDRIATALVVAVWLGGLPLILSVVGSRNHGTLD